MKKAVCVCNVKGGTGKTLVSLNLAKRLVEKGKKVALVDADLDNSSFSQFTDMEGVIEVDSQQRFKPFKWKGMEVFSMSLVTSRDQSVSMTGDRYVQIIDDVINRSHWDAEYFVFDMPGGSSEIFRTTTAIVGDYLVGNVIVSQPAMVDSTRKVLGLHDYLDIPILGVIENMSYLKVGAITYHPFGESTVDKIAAEYDAPVLGKIPLDPEIAEGLKKGEPFLSEEYMPPVSKAADLVIQEEIEKPGFLQRLRKKVSTKLKEQVEKVMANLIVAANDSFDVNQMRTQTGFTEEKPFLLVITNHTGQKEITRVGLRVTDESIKVLREPEGNEEYLRWAQQFNFQIVSDFQTFARIITGKAKRNGKTVSFSTWDAWCNGDLRAFGLGYAPRAVNAIRSVFEKEEVLEPVRQEYGGFLERWI